MEENNNKGLVLRKIELKVFIDTLVEVYNSGADYIDIVGNPEENQDTIGIVVHEEYMNADHEEMEVIDEEEELFEEDLEPKKDIPLSDEDINELI